MLPTAAVIVGMLLPGPHPPAHGTHGHRLQDVSGPAAPQTRDTRAPQTDQTISVASGARLTVRNFAGEVVIKTWDRDQLRVQARHVARAKVNVRQTGNAVLITSETSGAASVDYEINAPAWMPIKVEGTFNFITVEGAQSDVTAETVRGDVMIKGGNGTVIAKSIQGEVSVEGARGRITASSVNEGVRVAASSGDIAVETTNGHISLTRIASPNVDATTVNGHIVYEGTVADKGRYRFATHNGTITVTLPAESNATFNVRTYNGDFVSNLNLSGPPRSEVRRGRRVTYTLGNGSAEMEMESFGGSIKIQRSGSTSSTKDKKD